jgi:hypothetical protein
MSGVTPVHGSSPTYGADPPTETAPARPLDAMERLAALLVENDFLREEVDRQTMQAFRAEQQRAFREEGTAMHRAADALGTQAWVSGGLTMAGGLAQCAASLGPLCTTADAPGIGWGVLADGGNVLGRLAEPAGNLLGGRPKAHAEADAREAQGEATLAGERAEAAREHRQRVDRHTDAVLGLVETTLENEQRANLAILGNF